MTEQKSILIIAGLGSSLVRFRGDLINTWLNAGYEVVAAAPEEEAREMVENLGVKYITIPLGRTGMNPVQDLKLLMALKRLLGKEKPDYLFLYTIKPVIYGSLAAYFSKNCRTFSMITGLGYAFANTNGGGGFLKRLVSYLYRLALNRNEKVFFQNPDDQQFFLEQGLVDERKAVRVNGSGVNLEYFKTEPLPEGPQTFLLIARLIWEKGISEYIEAARLIKDKYAEARFMLVGWEFEDNPMSVGQKYLKQWQEEGLVEIHGETDDVRPFLKQCTVYVLPSYYREGTPRTVLEAMATGRAIITTDAPGCRETVIEGVNGFLVPVKDSRALAEAMEKFIVKPELAGNMGRASRKLAEEKYDVHKVNAEINRAMGVIT